MDIHAQYFLMPSLLSGKGSISSEMTPFLTATLDDTNPLKPKCSTRYWHRKSGLSVVRMTCSPWPRSLSTVSRMFRIISTFDTSRRTSWSFMPTRSLYCRARHWPMVIRFFCSISSSPSHRSPIPRALAAVVSAGLRNRVLSTSKLTMTNFRPVNGWNAQNASGSIRLWNGLQRFNVAEVFTYDASDLFRSLLRILVQVDLDYVAFLSFKS